MRQAWCRLVAMCLSLGVTGQAGADYIFTTIDVPGSISTSAYGITPSGQIVGGYSDAGGITHGFLFSGGSYTALDVPGSASTSATGINDAGQVVGSDFAGDRIHGFLLSGGGFTSLDVPGSISTLARGINDAGQIVGSYTDPAGITHGFLATPVPEPTTLALLGLGITALAGWRLQRKHSRDSSPRNTIRHAAGVSSHVRMRRLAGPARVE